MKALAACGLAVVGLALVVGLMWVSANNSEVRLRNRLVAQQKSNEATFDQTWKVIQSQAGVTTEYKESFRSTFTEIMNARYSGDKNASTLMKWVKEANPNFDSSLFKTLMNTIEAQRTNFTREQKLLLDLQREHNDVLTTFPSSLFVGSRTPIEVKIVTSGKTNQSFATGEENDVDPFASSKKNMTPEAAPVQTR